MAIYFATDHAGYELKETVLAFVRDTLGYDVHDCGAFALDADDDYPDFIAVAARAVSENPEANRAIIFGGSGQGEAMVANRFAEVRATVYYGGEPSIITLSREHNDANVLSLGARFLTAEQSCDAVKQWLETPFTGEERHVRRITKMNALQ